MRSAARPSEISIAALASPALKAILVAPSNPYLSIAPILAVPGLADALAEAAAPVIAVSPVVAGRALKGPTARIMADLGLEPSALAVGRHYRPWIDGFILDRADAALEDRIAELGMSVHCCNTVMEDLNDRIGLANAALEFAARCPRRRQA